MAGGHAWQGVMHGEWDVHDRGHAWQGVMLDRGCMWQERRSLQRAARILLECILVFHEITKYE